MRIFKWLAGIALILVGAAMLFNAYRQQGLDFSAILLFMLMLGLGVVFIRDGRRRSLRMHS